MTALLENFNNLIIEYEALLVADLNTSREAFPQHRIESYWLVEKFETTHLLRCLLYSDLLFTIRKAIATGGTVKASEWTFVKGLGIYLLNGLTVLRPDYTNLPAFQEQNIAELTNIWYQDVEIFGNSCQQTKLLCRDWIMFASANDNNPELFIKYKNLSSGIYKNILDQDVGNTNSKELVNDFECHLNKQFARKFYSSLTSKVITAKISTMIELKKKFKLFSIEPFQEICIDCVTLYEKRGSFEEVVPYENRNLIPRGKKAACINPVEIKINLGYSIEAQTKDVAVPESRRWSECPNCGGGGTEVCPNCIGTRYLRCESCLSGKLNCEHCNGNGAVKLSIPGSIVIDCVHCASTGKMLCKKCMGSSKVECLICVTGGKVPCKTCNAYGNVEFRQVIQIKRVLTNSSVRFSTIPKECGIKIEKLIFSHYLNVICRDLADKVLNNSLDKNLSLGFRDGISSHLLREKLKAQLDGEFVNQRLQVFRNFIYRLNYSLNGITCCSWWHPKLKTESISCIDFLLGILAAADKCFSEKKSFGAAKKVILAENLSRLDSSCQEEYFNYYKKLSIYKKFLVYVARIFVNPESIW